VGGDAELTRTGALLGTPAYMAPEQLQGRKADALSDQFSFCVALYEALYRERPFQGATLEELGQAARDGQVRPPRRDTQVPAWVRRVVLRGLRPRPEERFPSMAALLEVVTSRPRRARGWVAGSVLAVALLGVVGMEYGMAHHRETHCELEVERLGAVWSPERRERAHAAFLATGKPYATSSWERSATALDAYAAQWRTLRAEACRAVEAGDSSTSASQTAVCLDARLWQLAAVTEVLEQADAETVQHAPQLVVSLEGLAGCKDSPASSLRPQPPDALRPRVDAARRKLAEAQVRLDAGRHSEGLAVTASLLQEIQGLDYRPLEAEVLVAHGQLQGLGGKLKDAEESFYRALWAAEAGRDDEMTARVWIFLIWAVGDQTGRTEDAERVAQHARAAVERLGQGRFPAIAADLSLRLGVMLLGQDRLEQADAELSRGLELSKQSYGPDGLRTTYFVSSLGRVRTRQHRYAEALALFRQAGQMRERLLGPDHPGLASARRRSPRGAAPWPCWRRPAPRIIPASPPRSTTSPGSSAAWASSTRRGAT
jgi:tetratricopeptide (TPR) repeat protein